MSLQQLHQSEMELESPTQSWDEPKDAQRDNVPTCHGRRSATDLDLNLAAIKDEADGDDYYSHHKEPSPNQIDMEVDDGEQQISSPLTRNISLVGSPSLPTTRSVTPVSRLSSSPLRKELSYPEEEGQAGFDVDCQRSSPGGMPTRRSLSPTRQKTLPFPRRIPLRSPAVRQRSCSPGRTHILRSSSPVRQTSTSPGGTPQRSPLSARHGSPSAVGRSSSPGGIHPGSPSPVRQMSPSCVTQISPSLETTPQMLLSPLRQISTSPGKIHPGSPSPVRQISPSLERTHQTLLSPLRQISTSPGRIHPGSPSRVRQMSPSCVRQISPSLERTHQTLLSPLRQISTSPGRIHVRSPSPATARQRSSSPRKEGSPPSAQHGSPMIYGSPPPRKYSSGSPLPVRHGSSVQYRSPPPRKYSPHDVQERERFPSPVRHRSPARRRYSPQDIRRRRDRSLSRSPMRRRDTYSGSGRGYHNVSRSRSPLARDHYRRSPRGRYSPRRRTPPREFWPRRRSPRRRPWSPPPNRSTGVGKPGNNLFVAGFSFVTTERDLEKKFSRFGRVTDVRIVRDKRSGDSRGFGFLSLERDDEADAAIRALDQTEWNGRIVLVEKSKTTAR